MITLHVFGPGFGLPEMSPYVTKTEVQLQMANLDYVTARAMPDQSPKGQMPFIQDGGETIADSTFIRRHLETRHGVDLDKGLDADQRAAAWAYERMIENQLNWAGGHFRWLVQKNFDRGPAHFFDAAPEAVRASLRAEIQAKVRQAMTLGGVSRHTEDEILYLGERSLDALSRRLGGKAYMMGDAPCGLDAAAFGSLAGILTPFFVSPLARRAAGYGNLVAYVERMMDRHYPDFAWRPAQAA